MCWMDAQDEVYRVESMEVWGESNQVGNEFAKTNNHIINCKQFFPQYNNNANLLLFLY